MKLRLITLGILCVAAGLLPVLPVNAQDGEVGSVDAETKALDSTATQWSFQLAWQGMTYHDDTLSNGQQRPPGPDDYLQIRVLAPLPFEKITILPRLTLRHYKAPSGATGVGNSELFALIIPRGWDWGTGRMGIGPLITLPGEPAVAKDEWGYGFAAAIVNASGPWFYGILLTQVWRAVDPVNLPTGTTDRQPLGIAPIINYRLGGGWYIGNGDQVIQYDWDSKKWRIPLGVRIGKVLVKEAGSWNFYAEYQTSAYYKSWPGPAVDNSFRVNVTYTMPVF